MRTYLLFLPLWLIAGACLAQSPTIDKIRKSGTITLGYVEGAIPFSFIREAKPEGYSVELCERIAGDLRQQLKLPKLETRWVALTIQNRLDAVRQGKVDLECSTTSRTLSRQQQVDFSLLTYVDGASILVRNDDKLMRLSDFAGKKISVIAGTTTQQAMTKLLEKMRLDTQLVAVPSRAEGLSMLDKNTVDGFVSDRVALFASGITSPNAARCGAAMPTSALPWTVRSPASIATAASATSTTSGSGSWGRRRRSCRRSTCCKASRSSSGAS